MILAWTRMSSEGMLLATLLINMHATNLRVIYIEIAGFSFIYIEPWISFPPRERYVSFSEYSWHIPYTRDPAAVFFYGWRFTVYYFIWKKKASLKPSYSLRIIKKICLLAWLNFCSINKSLRTCSYFFFFFAKLRDLTKTERNTPILDFVSPCNLTSHLSEFIIQGCTTPLPYCDRPYPAEQPAQCQRPLYILPSLALNSIPCNLVRKFFCGWSCLP